MSDTRAAIRELRSLSEKRSLSALTEAEAARWMTLRRQLGLPLEPATVDEPAVASPPVEATPSPASGPEPVLAGPIDPAADTGEKPESTMTVSEADAVPNPVEAVAPEAGTHWAGPSLDSPTAPAFSAWVGPALDAPAWSDAAAERPTDPGIDGPPPAPFDEAPAATRPGEKDGPSAFGGSPDDRVPLAAVADFVSYGREGDDSIELPAESGPAGDFEQHSLAQFTSDSQADESLLPEAGGAPEPEPLGVHGAAGDFPERPRETEGLPYGALQGEQGAIREPPREMEPLPYEALETSDDVVREPPREMEPLPYDALETPDDVVREPPREMEPLPYDALETPDDVVREPPREMEPLLYEALGANEGVVPGQSREVQPQPPYALGSAEGVLPEPPAELEAVAFESPYPHEGLLPVSTHEASPFEALPNQEDSSQPPHELEASPAEVSQFHEGVLPELPFAHEVPPALADGMSEGAVPYAQPEVETSELEALPPDEHVFPGTPPPLQLGTPLSHAFDREVPEGAHSGLAGPPEPPPLASTWAPGSAEPPLLAADAFGRTGDPIGGRGLDPWPEGPPAESSAEDVVETVGDDDFVEDSTTPPQPVFPVARPLGSGGIRGFQFPKPPPGGPAFPTPVPWQRTEPGVPPFAAKAVSPAPGPLNSPSPPPAAPSPGLAAPTPSGAVVTPVPPAPPARSVTPTAVAPPQPSRPVSPPASAPLPPQPPPRTAIPVSRPTTVPEAPSFPTSAGVHPPAPVRQTQVAQAGPSLRPAAAAAEETVQPVLELVDEVEPAQAAAPTRRSPTPSPATGTPAVFGPPMMLNPSIVEGDHRVVVHTLEGQVHRGTVHDLDLQDDALAVKQPDGRSVKIPTRRVKAVFFVLAPGTKPLPTRGERVQVTFQDGRQVVGYSDDHATGEPGFFVVPSDARTNTARVYVFRGGVQSITTG